MEFEKAVQKTMKDLKISNIECRCCREDTEKRIVIIRKSLKELEMKLPKGYKEFYCQNIIKTKRVWKKERNKNIYHNKNSYKWIIEECRNHILVKKKGCE